MKSTTLNPDATRLTVDDQHPWLGLNAYTEETQAYFFGRNSAINELFTRVRENRLTTLFGQSGLGKTSLLGAGLLPKLKVESYRPQLIRLNFSEDAPPLVDQTRLALCKALEIESVNASATLWEILHHIDSRPKDLLQSLPVLVFDQFEEIFTLSGSRQAEVVEWFTQIADLVENRPPAFLQKQFRTDRQQAREFDTTATPVRIVITLREDYLSHLERWKSVMPSLMRNRMALHLLSGPEALEAAVCPGRRGASPIVSEEVGMQIVRKVARRPDNTPMEDIEAVPPFLSLLCEQLNAARLKSSPPNAEISSGLVTTLGDDILNNYYEESFADLPDALRHFVEDQLVSPSGHRNTLPLEDAEIELKKAGVQNARQLINALITRRLLAAEERNGITRLELTHDLLTPLAVRSRTTRREQGALRQARVQRRRQIKIASTLTVLMLLFAALAAFGWISFHEAEKQKAQFKAEKAKVIVAFHKAEMAKDKALMAESEALKASQRAEQAKSNALQTLSQSDFIQGSEYLEQDRSSKGMAYLARAIRTENTNLSAVARLYSALLYTVYPLPLLPPMQHQDSVSSAQFSPDCRFVVTASYDQTARVWDARTGKPVSPPMLHTGMVNSAHFSPNGLFVVTASADFSARVWDAKTGKPVSQPMQHAGSVNSAHFSPDGRFVVTASYDHSARVWDAQTGKPVSPPMQHTGMLNSAQFSPDGRFVVTASWDNTVRVWDAQTGKTVSQPMQHTDMVNSAQFSPDGHFVVTASYDHSARVWDAQTGKPVSPPMQHTDMVTSAQFSQDGRFVVTASWDNTARVWDAQTGKPVSQPMQHTGSVTSAQFSPDGRFVVTASTDNTARVWDAKTIKPTTHPIHADIVTSARFSPDGRFVVTASYDKTARVWDAQTGKLASQPMQHADKVHSAQFSPDGRFVVTASEDHSARVWDAQTGKPVFQPMQHTGSVTSAQFSPDGRFIVTASADFSARVWDAQTGKPVSPPMQHQSWVTSAQFSPDGRFVVTASADFSARVWDAQTGKSVSPLMQHQWSLVSAQFSPDGRFVVTASYDKTARVWDAKTGKAVSPPMQHQSWVTSAQFSPDGRFVVTASDHNSARVWDAQTGKPVFSPMQHADKVRSAQFSPDGRFVVTASEDHSARVWDAQTGKPVSQPMLHQNSVSSAQFSPDGCFVVTASLDKTARVWEILPKGGKGMALALAHFGEAVGQMRINSMGGEEKISADEFRQLRNWAKTNTTSPEARHLADWLLTPRDKRSSTPFRP